MIRIAIDGPGGAGKSTIAKLLADKLGIDYVDTGAMYRSIALKAVRQGVQLDNVTAVAEMLNNTEIDFNGRSVLLDGEDVSGEIRTPDISMAASRISGLACVRNKVNALSRLLGASRSLVMDGRDIGTNVITDAELKIFLTADPMVRARRRYDQLVEAGKEADLDAIYEDIMQRDYQDMHRELDPLKQADDAMLLDTSYMTIDEVVSHISDMVDRL